MIVSKELFKQIGDIVERQYNDFAFQLLGKDFLTPEQQLKVEALGLLVGSKPLIELLYLLVKQRTEPQYQDDRTLNDLLDEIFATGVIGPLPPEAQSTIDTSAIALWNTVENSKREAMSVINRELLKINKQAQSESRLEEEQTSEWSGLALAAVGAALLLVHKKFKRDFTTELTNFVNHATVDSLKEDFDQTEGEVLVYKLVTKDASLCNWCGKAYVNPDGTPKVYPLKELVANGSNFGKPKSQWLPVVDAHHFNCRCQLMRYRGTETSK
jgi:hypothetical protein